jgi:hypothetical protein
MIILLRNDLRAPYPSRNSLYSLYIDEVVPTALRYNNPKATRPAIFIVNKKSLRFDLYAGAFTKDDQATIAIYNDTFRYVESVPLSVVEEAIKALNTAAPKKSSSTTIELSPREGRDYDLAQVDSTYRAWLLGMSELAIAKRSSEDDRTVGYVTKDVIILSFSSAAL